jgi:(R,R)-butanediol dehydrogenase/meso-butanediol dehydrogenase/diacetyl reductase/L-iditol 2-dehydrogenase
VKALRYLGPQKILLQEQPEPAIKEDEVLIKIMASGICGSDIHGYLGTTGRRIAPMTMGHEFSGQIVKLGSKIKLFDLGARVIVQPLNFCGKCIYCQQGNTNMCVNGTLFGVMAVDGAMAEYLAVPEKLVFTLPEKCSYEIGAMAEPFAVAYGAVKKAGDLINKNVLIVGAGTIGLCILQIVKLQSPKLIIVSDLSDNRLKVATELGADNTINPKNQDYFELVKRLTDENMIDVSFEAVGIAAATNQSLRVLKKMGTSIWVGNSAREIEINMQDIVTSALKICGTYIYTHEEFGEVVDIIGTGNLRADNLISKVIPLEEAPETFTAIHKQPDSFIKVIINPTK